MTVDTARVTGRRALHFASLDEVLAEVDRLAAAPRVRALGNWTLPQALMHLAGAYSGSIDGYTFRVPWYFRLLGPLLRRRMISRPMPSGFTLPGNAAAVLVPDASTTCDEALAALRRAVQRLTQETKREPNPVLGRLTREQWDQLHERHAELHLSFFVPEMPRLV